MLKKKINVGNLSLRFTGQDEIGIRIPENVEW
jgi:hypothetical protein